MWRHIEIELIHPQAQGLFKIKNQGFLAARQTRKQQNSRRRCSLAKTVISVFYCTERGKKSNCSALNHSVLGVQQQQPGGLILRAQWEKNMGQGQREKSQVLPHLKSKPSPFIVSEDNSMGGRWCDCVSSFLISMPHIGFRTCKKFSDLTPTF